jgi:acetoin utilization deacetylase AcuC-like enzyme
VRSSSRELVQELRRGRGRLAARLWAPYLAVVYSDRYQVDLPGTDSQRGERVLAALAGAGLLRRRALHRAEPASFRELRRIHTDDYLDSLTRPGALLQIFGLELPDYAAERALEAQRAMAGGTLLASRLALASGKLAANLGGGLHHAFAARGERFCIVNDVCVAIAALRAAGFVEPILIVDLDLHDGDGTRSIFAHDRSVHCFSIHNRTNSDVPGHDPREAPPRPPPPAASPAGPAEAPSDTTIELGDGVTDPLYLDTLAAHLPPVFARVKPGLVYYLAGCDLAADDALGNWQISAAGMLRRDRMVIDLARRPDRRAPLVVLLAGGYGQSSWRYSARFLSSLRLGGRPVEPPSTNAVTLTRYRRLDREIFGATRGASNPPAATQADWSLGEEDLLPDLQGPHRPRRLLGAFTAQQLELTLERAGLLERLRQLGYALPAVTLDLDHPAGETVQVYGDPGRHDLLVETRLRIDRRTVPDMALLRIEWLLLQNPRETFTPLRPRLPGQDHPGLGMLRDTIAMLLVACERLQLDGVLWVPAHYPAAVQGRGAGRFLHPADEGLFRALARPLAGLPLHLAATLVSQGWIEDVATGEPFVWRPMPTVVAVSERLRSALDAGEYEHQAAAAAARHRFALRPGAPLPRTLAGAPAPATGMPPPTRSG